MINLLKFVLLATVFCLTSCPKVVPGPIVDGLLIFHPAANYPEPPDNPCLGPRCLPGDVAAQPTINYPPSMVIDVSTLPGIDKTGNINTINRRLINNAAKIGKILYFPPGDYYVHNTINLRNGVYGEGRIICPGYICFSTVYNNVFIRGITIESTDTSRTESPVAALFRNSDNAEISYCTLINNRITHENQDTTRYHYGFKVIQNRFIGDFSKVSEYTRDKTQNDLITVRGIDRVDISCNSIKVIRPHRVLKIADHLKSPYCATGPDGRVSNLNSKNITVRDNKITGWTTSGKQVIDLFNGTENILYSGGEERGNFFF